MLTIIVNAITAIIVVYNEYESYHYSHAIRLKYGVILCIHSFVWWGSSNAWRHTRIMRRLWQQLQLIIDLMTSILIRAGYREYFINWYRNSLQFKVAKWTRNCRTQSEIRYDTSLRNYQSTRKMKRFQFTFNGTSIQHFIEGFPVNFMITLSTLPHLSRFLQKYLQNY